MKKFKTASGEPPVLHRNTANLMQSMLDEVKANITIFPELKALIPPLQAGEYEQLKSNILKDGCREPLLIWQTTQGAVDGSVDDTPVNVLIDGHNRHEICTANGVEFKVSLREFATLQAVRDFMIDNQLGRRNLTPEQMSYLRGLKYRNERQTVGRPVAEEGRSGTENVEKQAERTRDRLAKEFNVSPRTILRDRDYSEGLDRLEPTLKQEVLKGTQKLPKEVIREIGKTASPEVRPLSLADVQALAPVEAAAQTATPATVSKEVRDVLKKIAQIAKALDPNATEFVADCDQLIALLKQAKQQVK